MKIVMLGHSSAGKTTYMAQMYAEMNAGAFGFAVEAVEQHDHARLRGAGLDLAAGRYPPPTDRRAEYPLRLLYGRNPVMDFRWRDYRGGALTERTASSAEAAWLRADLDEADAIVIFVDVHELHHVHEARRKVRSIIVPVANAVAGRRDVTPLVIGLTKSDLLPGDIDLSDTLECFASLVEAIQSSDYVHGTIIELACGRDPRNVIAPVLWCLYFGVAMKAVLLNEQVERHLGMAATLRREATWWRRLDAYRRNQTSPLILSQRETAEALAQYQQLEPLIEPVRRLETLLSELPHF